VAEAEVFPAPAPTIATLAARIVTAPRGLLIIGPQTDPELAEPLLQLAREAGYPILADPLSQLRDMADADNAVICSYDAFLRDERFCMQYKPQLILRFGAMPVAKPVLLYAKRYAASCTQIVIDGQGGWDEPTQLASQVIHADPTTFCQQLGEALGEFEQTQQVCEERATWTEAWRKTERVTRQALTAAIADFPELFEGRVFTELAELLPTGALLYAANSMPIRDMDTFFWPQQLLSCLGNRGANGIDGVISSALGASAAGGFMEPGAQGPAVLVIGDLSFFHDLNGLLAARLHDLNLVIILVNNDGGGIFSFLPQAAYPEHFEQLFGTPTGLDFRPVVEMYGGSFQRANSWDEFRQALHGGLNTGGLHVIEIPTERASNVTMHRQLWQVMEQALEQADLFQESEA
jgi:2-succinyl-5-enolpyruvyl-6-hydroxy-3-cyclohexene-1-carboxylate synthase